MRNRWLLIGSAVGLLVAIVSAYLFAEQPGVLPPAFRPAANPYASGIYAVGIVESAQAQGSNINIYPEVTGPITQVLIAEGDQVHEGDPLLRIDDSVQRAIAEQQQSQAQAADDQLAKQERSYLLDPKSVSGNDLDNARNAQKIAKTNLAVIEKQYALTKAGAWTYDIQNQDKQYIALSKGYAASAALLAKYTIRAPTDGVVRSVDATVGSYVSPQGAYDPYTQGFDPLIVMGTPDDKLQVRVYVDEILIHRIGSASKMDAQMFIRGTDTHLPLTFVRIQPFVSPKIELSDQRTERVDLRVLPLIFRFEKPRDLNVYPGQLVDVYISEK
jgi:HlyD family secretion protein